MSRDILPPEDVRVHILNQSDLQRCPLGIPRFAHYRADGTCRCDDASHLEMIAWGYAWDGTAWR
jgi:hypothetical protein